jgi:hypothetical protein
MSYLRYGAFLIVGLGVALSACGCATSDKILTNLQGCERHYKGTISGGMTGGAFAGDVQVDCAPTGKPPAASVAAVVAPPAPTPPAT